MIKLSDHEVWFITGSQHLYGEETLKNVAKHSDEIARYLNETQDIPVNVVHKPIVTTADEITTVCREANVTDRCVGVIVWMHTFSPAKMWIGGLQLLSKPMCHLHTQYNSEIPWKEIDMDFMNENQSAHGGREFGFMAGRLRKNRKVVTGHWKDKNVHKKLGTWSRVAVGWHALQTAKIARIGDNMRQVAVTEGDKVEAQMRFGLSVNGYGIGDVVEYLNTVTDKEINTLLATYKEQYETDHPLFNEKAVKDAARIELGLRAFLEEGGFTGFTNTFEDLHGFKQLPGIATQRFMADGYGYGGEGDWKTAALVHVVKVMTQGLEGGTSFMEDYTYDFREGGSRVLGSHMLEICPSIASGKPRLEVHPLSIGGKEDPARLVFNVGEGPAINAALMDMGNRFRLVVNEVQTVEPEHELPRLPVARALWKPEPDLETAASAWILAGGSHHTVYSKAATVEFMEDLAEMAGVELLTIDRNTAVRDFKEKLRWNEVYYHLFQNKL